MTFSSDRALIVKNVSKCFEMYDKPVHRLFQTLSMGRKTFYKEFWALKDVDFELKRGESLGIIGRNGAGKSTLLQIITGTLQPTTGTVEMKGRVAALLELGSGFNPEFTGKDNVYMNASILGLTKKEIDAKYDDIVAFADIGEFIDQPVKTYSSGMMVRLAFAVQTVIEPDILIIDEALAVGDARFQLKCFKRLNDLRDKGTTLLFVSHAIEQVKSLCNYGLLLNQGSQLFFGDSKEAGNRYMRILFPEQASNEQPKSESTTDETGHDTHSINMEDTYFLEVKRPAEESKNTFGTGGAWLDWIKIYGLDAPNVFHGGETLKIICKYSWDKEIIKELIRSKALNDNITLGISLANVKGEYIFGCNGFDIGLPVSALEQNTAVFEFVFTMPFLKQGDYFLSTAIAVGNQQHLEHPIWYDYFIQLHNDCTRNIYGIMSIPYSIKKLETNLIQQI